MKTQEPSMPNLAGARILVTGGTGFLGRAVLRKLKSMQCKVVVAPVRRMKSAMEPSVMYREITSFSDPPVWREILTDVDVDVVIHCAGLTPERDALRKDWSAFREANVAATTALAKEASIAKVRRFIFVSSVKVHGEMTLPGQRLSPEDPPMPEGAYAVSKLEAEIELRKISSTTDMEVVIIRPPLIYGPGVKGNFASMVRWIRYRLPIPKFKNAEARSFIALQNVVDFIVHCADIKKSESAANEVFLISDGDDISIATLAARIGGVIGIRPWFIPLPSRFVDFIELIFGENVVKRFFQSLVIDNSKAIQLLGWKPVITMQDQLREMVEDDTTI